MTPEHIVLQMTDGTEFAALIHMEAGKLHVSAGGFLGLTFVIEPESARQVCHRIIELINNDRDICKDKDVRTNG